MPDSDRASTCPYCGEPHPCSRNLIGCKREHQRLEITGQLAACWNAHQARLRSPRSDRAGSSQIWPKTNRMAPETRIQAV